MIDRLHSLQRATRKGFTLVELLVVIAIIAVLISMLLPTLTKARRAAQQAVCLSNLRQISLAVLNYSSINQGRIPLYDNVTYNGVTDSVHGILVGFWALIDGKFLPSGSRQSIVDLHGDTSTNVMVIPLLKCPGEPQELLSDWGGTAGFLPQIPVRFRNGVLGSVFTGCGGDARHGRGEEPAGWYQINPYRIFTHYGLNGSYPSYVNPSNPAGCTPPGFRPFASVDNAIVPKILPEFRITKIHAANTWMVFDCTWADYAPALPCFRHRGISANFVYFDGHGENLKAGEVDSAVSTPTLVIDARQRVDQ